jgi:hypothetical protein
MEWKVASTGYIRKACTISIKIIKGKYSLKDLSLWWEDNIATNIRNSNWGLWAVFVRFRTEPNEHGNEPLVMYCTEWV